MDTDQIIVIIILCAAAMLISAALYLHQRARRRLPEHYDGMELREFVRYCAELLEKNGFREVEGIRDRAVALHDGEDAGGAGEQGAVLGVDLLAKKDGVTYAILCRCGAEAVGVEAVQCACAGREYHGKMVGVVLAAGRFTPQAMETAEKLKVLLWGRERLEEMLEKSA